MEGSGSREGYKALSKPCSSRFLRRVQAQQFCLVFIFRGAIVKIPQENGRVVPSAVKS